MEDSQQKDELSSYLVDISFHVRHSRSYPIRFLSQKTLRSPKTLEERMKKAGITTLYEQGSKQTTMVQTEHFKLNSSMNVRPLVGHNPNGSIRSS